MGREGGKKKGEKRKEKGDAISKLATKFL